MEFKLHLGPLECVVILHVMQKEKANIILHRFISTIFQHILNIYDQHLDRRRSKFFFFRSLEIRIH